jgi:adenosylcobinamide kinase/adenosylcobinamide-phosphate guanylyltransferase
MSSASGAKIQTKRKPQISLLIGGCKSGKSSYSHDYALGFGYNSNQRVIIATSKSRIDEVTKKSESLKTTNDENYTIIEDSTNIEKTIKNLSSEAQIVIIDNISVWLSNLLKNKEDVDKKQKDLLDFLANPKQDVIIISNMIGLGIVPDEKCEKALRDLSGNFNQQLAKLSDNVILLIAGLPLKVKGDLL